VNILELRHSEYRQASLTLTRAFFNYPDLSYYFPDLNKRQAQLNWMLYTGLVQAGRIGKVFKTEDNLGSMALLLPDSRNLNFWDTLASGALKAPFIMSRESFQRMQFCETYALDTHREVMAGRPHFYIWYLGVEPNAQGGGLGSALIHHVQTLASQEKKPIYLETHKPATVAFYKHLGFQLLAENPFPGHPLSFYNMLWEPKTA
jgi:ribosomal protein S18 acetylase RimI-like enzyme